MTESAQSLDLSDTLAPMREEFLLPEDVVYLDGNSLGPLTRASKTAIDRVVSKQWGDDLISSWNRHGWIDLPERVGEKIAPLIGAAPGQVLCVDSISINLFKLLSAALALRPGRSTILLTENDFPTDGYVAEGLASLIGGDRCRLRRVSPASLTDALDEDVAVLMLTQVNYRTGELYSMEALTRAAHEAGALVLWDLAHSAGALPISLDACAADLAVGCGYKYLNGGPGSPAFVYVNQNHQAAIRQPLSGWLGHRSPFDFSPSYEPAAGVLQFQAGTPPIISLASLDAALDMFAAVDLESLREKSLALTSYFMERLSSVESLRDLRVLTPQDAGSRGSQVSVAHPQAWGISQALIEAGIIVDFRAPNIVRFGFAPLYNSFSDAQAALKELASIFESGRHEDSKFQQRPKVT
ncbi:MAG: kynureninase [Pseudomonadota bacterium]